MLSLYEFNLMPFSRRSELLQLRGKHLLTRKSPPFVVNLYSLGDFLVEAYFSETTCEQDSKTIKDILSFRYQDLQTIRRPHPLAVYLDKPEYSNLLSA